MVNLVYHIAIQSVDGKRSYRVAQLLKVEKRSSVEKISDTATLWLPAMAYGRSLDMEDKVGRGDRIQIQVGYQQPKPLFEGYITSVSTDKGISVECEDAMYLARVPVPSKQYAKKNLADILRSVTGSTLPLDVGPGVSDIAYDKFTVSDTTLYEVYKKIKEDAGIHIFYAQGKVRAYLSYTWRPGQATFDFSKNVVASNLRYVCEHDKKVEVKVVGIDKKNKKTEVTAGAAGGDSIVIHRYNVSDQAALQRIAQEELIKYRYTGYEGDITTWLNPRVEIGFSATIQDDHYPRRQGTYYVTSVENTFSQEGGRQKITLGLKLS